MAGVSAEDMRTVSPGSQLKAQRPVRVGHPWGSGIRGRSWERGPWTGQPQWGVPLPDPSCTPGPEAVLTWDHPGSGKA